MVKDREITFAKAINEAIDLCLKKDPAVYIMGLGVPDPKGIFGSTLNLVQKHGSNRVFDMPVSENGMTGIAIGAAITGMRPVMTHQRMGFALLATDQIINNAAKWHYMSGGKLSVPLTIRMIIGRGWGQGAQHSQNLQALYMHIPGLKVVMPTTPYDAKGLLVSSIEDDNPVIFIEHRWLYNIKGHVPEGVYRVPLGKAVVVRSGEDVTIASTSYMTIESIRASDILAKAGVGVEVVDIRTLKPLGEESILESVKKTGRLIVVDSGYPMGGVGAEVAARMAERAFHDLKCPVSRISLPDCPTPMSPGLTKYYYPRAGEILKAIRAMLHLESKEDDELRDDSVPHDVPDKYFTGPF